MRYGCPRGLPATLRVLGQKTFPIGETPRAANLVKLSGNSLLASVIEALREAMALVSTLSFTAMLPSGRS